MVIVLYMKETQNLFQVYKVSHHKHGIALSKLVIIIGISSVKVQILVYRDLFITVRVRFIYLL